MRVIFVMVFFLIILLIGCNYPVSQKKYENKIINIDPAKKATSYGTTKWIPIGSTIPPDWIIIWKENGKYQIKYVGGAAYGKTEGIREESPIPSNWVIVGTGMSGSNVKWYIEYVGNAVYGATVWIRAESSIPYNWIISDVGMSGSNYKWQIMYIGGALYGQKINLRAENSIPTNWVIIDAGMNGSNTKWIIQYAGGAALGVTIWILTQSPIPAGWELVDVTQNCLRFQIKYTGKIVVYGDYFVFKNPPVFKWPAGANIYWVLASDNPKVASGNICVDAGNLTTNVYAHYMRLNTGTYYWKVKYKASTTTTDGTWSPVQSFTIK